MEDSDFDGALDSETARRMAEGRSLRGMAEEEAAELSEMADDLEPSCQNAGDEFVRRLLDFRKAASRSASFGGAFMSTLHSVGRAMSGRGEMTDEEMFRSCMERSGAYRVMFEQDLERLKRLRAALEQAEAAMDREGSEESLEFASRARESYERLLRRMESIHRISMEPYLSGTEIPSRIRMARILVRIARELAGRWRGR